MYRGSVLAAAAFNLLLLLVVVNSESSNGAMWHAFDPNLIEYLKHENECQSLWNSTKTSSYMHDWSKTDPSSSVNNFQLWPGNYQQTGSDPTHAFDFDTTTTFCIDNIALYMKDFYLLDQRMERP